MKIEASKRTIKGGVTVTEKILQDNFVKCVKLAYNNKQGIDCGALFEVYDVRKSIQYEDMFFLNQKRLIMYRLAQLSGSFKCIILLKVNEAYFDDSMYAIEQYEKEQGFKHGDVPVFMMLPKKHAFHGAMLANAVKNGFLTASHFIESKDSDLLCKCDLDLFKEINCELIRNLYSSDEKREECMNFIEEE